MRTDGSHVASETQGGTFTTTHWSVVLAAGSSNTPQGVAALEQLCRTYWYPLYAFIRRQGYSPQDAEDLLQGFLARIVERGWIQHANPSKGRCRSFMLVSLKHFLANERDKARALKRGGWAQFLSFEHEASEGRYWEELASVLTPERLYEQRWACVLLERVMQRLEADFTQAGRGDLFEAVKGFLAGDTCSATYAELAKRFGLSESALKMQVWRLRQRYQRLLREEISHTVATPEEVEEEIRYLFRVLSG